MEQTEPADTTPEPADRVRDALRGTGPKRKPCNCGGGNHAPTLMRPTPATAPRIDPDGTAHYVVP